MSEPNTFSNLPPARPVSYHTHDIAVRGGCLRVGEWRPQGPWAEEAPVVVALHCMEGAHLVWASLAAALPEVRIIAPDLRGRGRSAGLPGPFGIDQHATDILTVMDALQLSGVTLVGHSLGAFAAVAALQARRESFTRAVLVDGGLPLTVPLTCDPADLLETVLGRRAAGLELVFSSPATHRRFRQMHPAFARDWSPELDTYVDYLLDETLGADAEIEYRPIASQAALSIDARELSGSTALWERLREVDDAAVLLTAPRGLLNEAPGVYSVRELEIARREWPGLNHRLVAHVNHYTIITSRRGAAAIATEVRRGFERVQEPEVPRREAS
ncbi:alpha/beta fold hydrolase [Subtercola boreus]|uniref:AB hydrolase-1 domain-containing protein n=1 Tax=Subtercola boreus TaxID=120213 RepID=A0A3E0WCX4_9MICO|nr:alpha/beta fold hydrolase [Subtercola boreus]RFA20800.1 hypothetical protein B7R24_08510 [Subtercola boreus]RFA20915.1 hypothetical protein B7R23_08450 [Subtercola boreus]RFA27108.1 hypothetical protein B7R25_08575 [Subtercola boreus]